MEKPKMIKKCVAKKFSDGDGRLIEVWADKDLHECVAEFSADRARVTASGDNVTFLVDPRYDIQEVLDYLNSL